MKYILLAAALIGFNVTAGEYDCYTIGETTIKTESPDLDGIKDALGTVNDEYDYNDNGIVDPGDFSYFKTFLDVDIQQELRCEPRR